MKKKILIVTKDRAEYMVYLPVAIILRAAGYEVIIIAEGLSLAMWCATDWTVYKGVPDPRNPLEWNQNNGFRLDINAEEVLRKIQPALVMCGLGAPINLGRSFGIAASALGIMLGCVEDVWGAHSRLGAIPDFICTLDNFGHMRIKAHVPFQAKMPRIFITGTPALADMLVPADKTPAFQARIIGHQKIVAIMGQDEVTTALIKGATEALAGRGETLVIPKLHPKWLQVTEESVAKASPEERPKFQMMLDSCRLWRQMLGALPNVYWPEPSVTAKEIIQAAGDVLSVYSNALHDTAMAGKRAISWNSPVGAQKMIAELGGIERFPLVGTECLGISCAVEVQTAADYLALPQIGSEGYHQFTRTAQEAMIRQHRDSPQSVVSAIKTVLN